MKTLNVLSGLITLIFLFGISYSIVFGYDKEIICNDDGCSGLSGALFNENNIYPGTGFKKSLNIKNDKDENLKITLSSTEDEVSDDDFAKKATIVIYDEGNVIFGNTFSNFLGKDIDLGEVEKADQKLYEFEVNFPEDSGNEYQGKQINFSLSLNFQGEESGESQVLSGADADDDDDNGSQGEVKSATTEDNSLIGKILGLSNTSSNNKLLNIFFLLLGLVLTALGIKYLRTQHRYH